MAIKGFPGSKGSGMHIKVGGGSGHQSDNRTSHSQGGVLSGLPPKASNPYRQARMITNRTIGLAKMPGKGIY